MLSVAEHAVNLVEPDEWDDVVRQFADYTVFHTWAWMRTVSAAHGVRPFLTQVQCEGQCQAVWPFLELKKGPLRIMGSPLPGWSTAYMGPLFHPEADSRTVLRAFLDHSFFRKHAYCACKVINRHRAVDLCEFGFDHVLDLDTFRIDLTQSTETLWGNLKSECRTRIRKAQKLGIEIRQEIDDSFIDDFWKMSVETFQKSNIQPTHSERFVRELWKNLGEQGNVYVTSATQGGRRLGMLVMLMDDHTMYYWGGASFVAYRDLPAHNLLHWQAICHAKEIGLKEYDFISTFGGPGRFKKTFGPQVVAIATHWERSQSRLIAALKRQYQNYLLLRRRIKP